MHHSKLQTNEPSKQPTLSLPGMKSKKKKKGKKEKKKKARSKKKKKNYRNKAEELG